MSRLKKWLGKEESPKVPVVKAPVKAQAVDRKKSGLKASVIKAVEVDYYRYLVSKALLLQPEEENDSELPDDRILLDIELAPALARQAEKQQAKDLFNALQEQLFKNVEHKVETRLANLDPTTLDRFTPAVSLMDAVNILNTKAASVARIKPLLLKHTSLLKNLITTLNRLGMGKKHSDKALELKDAELCLSSLGVEKLRIFLPYLIVNELLKDTGMKFNQTSRKLWLHVQITAEASKALAAQDPAVNESEAYMMAMLHELGAIFMLHLVDECFKESRNEVSALAMEQGAAEVSHQLSDIKSAVPVLDKLLGLKAPLLSAEIAKRYKLNFFMLANNLEELSRTMAFDDFSPMARIIAQGRAYSVFKQMYKESLIDKTQAAGLLNYYQLDTEKIKYLNKQKYLKVPIMDD
ncbi:HDOD domain-containing protein [Psychrobium sp. 1_MG-2023]|uniref:HDOD domain-containing protein n=1 Tax=Psychrobium sp. 1_MG-2023 TaxID=3062624 RepID=UPI000C32CCE1|nr:HDOD domain-containing protein [Psychrobium sp. 1_MG-2023]MDP2560826.1 HDOD domain-containing protein [Psychrobium sp. 1_MG-2023]PKF56700.1 hypothetical protein CW748_09485 [Alteromonadales bacterium alter-6D02]